MSAGFSELGIEKDLVEALDVSGISKPFEIQKITIYDKWKCSSFNEL